MSMFRVGDFSRLSRVSVKMLRHYDEIGLLKPAWVDPLTDYRYYSADQLPRLNRILALKDLGFTLEQVAGLLQEDVGPERIRSMLTAKRAEIEAELHRQAARLAAVEARLRLIEARADSPYEVVLRQVGSQLAACLRKVLPTADDMEQIFDDVETYVAGHGARAASPPLAIYYDPEYREQEVDVEIAIPVTRPLPEHGPLRTRELPAVALMACVVHVGDYATLGQASNALYLWVEANGYRAAGPNREVYLRFGVGSSLGDVALPPIYLAPDARSFVTELQLPVERDND
jgi:DNA-binding transcriptional MerR regulator